MSLRINTVFVMILLSLIGSPVGCSNAGELPTRPAAVAGKFYPDDAEKLRRAIDYFMADAIPGLGSKPIAIAAPHAGYIYSGQIAADAYRQACGFEYDLVVILGTNHTTPGFNKVSIYNGAGYRTPLGVAPIDTAVVKKLLAMDRRFIFDLFVHTNEHSVEVQVPFVQHLFPDAAIVPLVIGVPDMELCERLAAALAEVLRDKKALIVASSDLSHYPAHDAAVAVDQQTLEAVVSLDPEKLHQIVQKQLTYHIANLSTCACGEAPLMTAMLAAKKLGANCGSIVSYANSGDVSIGSPERVVGYSAIAFTNSDDCVPDRAFSKIPQPPAEAALNDAQKQKLLAFARQTIEQYLTSETVPLARDFEDNVFAKQGAFVTLKKNGHLRGCIGHMAEDRPLCQVVGQMAIQAAFNDRRFQPLQPDEWDDIELEISVLTPFKKVDSYADIVIGRDGIVLEKNGHRAVYLPQVAPEQGWDLAETLSHLSQKAGLTPISWKEGATFYTFQADVFAEKDDHRD